MEDIIINNKLQSPFKVFFFKENSPTLLQVISMVVLGKNICTVTQYSQNNMRLHTLETKIIVVDETELGGKKGYNHLLQR